MKNRSKQDIISTLLASDDCNKRNLYKYTICIILKHCDKTFFDSEDKEKLFYFLRACGDLYYYISIFNNIYNNDNFKTFEEEFNYYHIRGNIIYSAFDAISDEIIPFTSFRMALAASLFPLQNSDNNLKEIVNNKFWLLNNNCNILNNINNEKDVFKYYLNTYEDFIFGKFNNNGILYLNFIKLINAILLIIMTIMGIEVFDIKENKRAATIISF